MLEKGEDWGNSEPTRKTKVYIVTKHLNDDSPVYEVVSESGPKKH